MRHALTFGVFTDAHYAEREPAIGRHYADSPAKLAALLAEFTAARADLLLNLGDLIDTSPTPAAELAALRALAAQLAATGIPCRHVLGNHDLQALTKDEVRAACAPDWTANHYAFSLDWLRVVVLDGCCLADGRDYAAGNFSWTESALPPGQLAWLARELAAAPGPVLVCCHQNLDHPGPDPAPDPHFLRNAAAVRAVLHASGKVRAVLQGHYHPGRQQVLDGIPYLTFQALATGAGVAQRAGALVTLEPDGGVRVTGLGVQPSWGAAG
jgi:alkaline phosphatase